MAQENAAYPPRECGRGGELELTAELAALASLLCQSPPEAQAPYRDGVQWLPAGVLAEQLVADLTIVHALPKVGGTTIAATLNTSPAVRPEALHLHYLSTRGLAALRGQIAGCSHPNVRYLQAHLAQAVGARALLAANRVLRERGLGTAVRKPFLIAGVREPVALGLSLAFEGWSLTGDLDVLSDEFLHAWVTGDPLSRVWDDWFADELGAMSGVDVYARPFPTDRGWDVYESDTARVLVVRQENLDRLPDALGALYGLPPATFAVRTRNVGSGKEYAGRYERARRALRLSRSELDRAYDPRYVRHFYTDDEIARFRRRWDAEAPPSGETVADAPAHPVPTSLQTSTLGNERHPWACRPCWHCERRLQSIPGLEHACSEHGAKIRQLEAETAVPTTAPPTGSFARTLRAAVRRLIRLAASLR